MKIKMNLKGNFKLAPEGERVLKITKAECKPSGKPNNMKVTFQDVEEESYINSQYNFDNDKSLFAMGKMLEVALGIEDGDEFDTKDTEKLVGKLLLCEVVHTEGTKPNEDGELPVFANIKKVISLIDENGEVKEESSPRNSIKKATNIDDALDDLD